MRVTAHLAGDSPVAPAPQPAPEAPVSDPGAAPEVEQPARKPTSKGESK